MSRDRVKEIADAVLYEGYVLYPYRPSSIKNRQRWTFGGVFPQNFSLLSGSDPWFLASECLIEGDPQAVLTVQLRFLHLVVRSISKYHSGDWHYVPSLEVDGHPYAAWEEATAQEITAPATTLASLAAEPLRLEFAFADDVTREILRDGAGATAGAITRTRRKLEGALLVSAVGLGPQLHRITVRVENTTPLTHDQCESRALSQHSAFASTHAILRLQGGDFVSQTDPPEHLAPASRQCQNEGWWPVLAGPDSARDTMLVSPIILYDHPEIAPESPGDLFDGTEIDEILTLRILTMTDAEKREAAASDPLTRRLLERTEALTANDMAKLHGALRSPRQPALASVSDQGQTLQVGSRVLLKPKSGGDVMDIVLAGKIAIVEAIERDFEDRVHVAVTIEDDPGRDLGLDRYPGHRFFFSREELEPIAAEASP